jgi:arginine-tRNA-protein transferase
MMLMLETYCRGIAFIKPRADEMPRADRPRRRWTARMTSRTIALTVNTDERYRFSGPCPYLKGNTSSGEFFLGGSRFSRYEELLAAGWRRTGPALYRYRCGDCSSCVPLRLRSDRLERGGRARRLARRNADLSFALLPPGFTDERFALYADYIRVRHGGSEAGLEDSFHSLIASPMAALSEYRDPDGKLLALGFLDILPNGLSSVYFAFSPAASRRSLGAHSVFAESAAGLALGKSYYYLGFWVPDAPSMDYKADFRPFELARRKKLEPRLGGEAQDPAAIHAAPFEWIEFADKEEASRALSALARR